MTDRDRNWRRIVRSGVRWHECVHGSDCYKALCDEGLLRYVGPVEIVDDDGEVWFSRDRYELTSRGWVEVMKASPPGLAA